MATSESKLSMKLFIDTKARKVLFAEAKKDCVDYLFTILSLHVSNVISLLKDKGMNYGCLSNLYDSVDNLDVTYIQPSQNKDDLLKLKSPIGISSVPFLLVDGVPTKSYGCSSRYCYTISDNPRAVCPNCRSSMSCALTYVAPPGDVKEAVATSGGFVKEVATYMVMDDLVIKPLSSVVFLNEVNVKDVGVLQEQVVNFGKEEALKLLKASFESKSVLTDVFLTQVKEEKDTLEDYIQDLNL